MSTAKRATGHTIVPAVVALAGLAGLALRHVGPGSLVIVIAVGAAGLSCPIPWESRLQASRVRFALAVAIGVAGMVAVRSLGLFPRPQLGTFALCAALAAAVAEEAFFRRFLYGWLLERGELFAVIGAAVAFAAVHVPLYGPAAFPLDVAAGVLFGWQRSFSGGWAAPAISHAAANVLVFL